MSSGCVTKKGSVLEAAADKPKAALWPSDESHSGDGTEEISEAVIKPVSSLRLEQAIHLLESRSFMQISQSRAEELIGQPFSARRAMLDEAEKHQERSESFAERVQENSSDSSAREIMDEEREIARHLRSQSWHLTPYLVRAIGLRGCGTGYFFARRKNHEIWLSFGGLGTGFTPENQAVVIYLNHPPTAIHLGNPSTCL